MSTGSPAYSLRVLLHCGAESDLRRGLPAETSGLIVASSSSACYTLQPKAPEKNAASKALTHLSAPKP